MQVHVGSCVALLGKDEEGEDAEDFDDDGSTESPVRHLTTKLRLGIAMEALAAGEVTIGGVATELPALPGLTVLGQVVSLPVTDATAAQLYASGVVSPHGQGEKTVVDPAVRSSREYNPVSLSRSACPA